VHATLKYHVDIANVLGVSLNREIHECHFEFQESCNFDRFSLLFNNLVGVLFEKLKDVKLFVNGNYIGFS